MLVRLVTEMTELSGIDIVENKDKALMSQIMSAIRGIKHGHILMTIHDSEVVQIDKTEKERVPRPRDCICQVADPKTGGKTSFKK